MKDRRLMLGFKQQAEFSSLGSSVSVVTSDCRVEMMGAFHFEMVMLKQSCGMSSEGIVGHWTVKRSVRNAVYILRTGRPTNMLCWVVILHVSDVDLHHVTLLISGKVSSLGVVTSNRSSCVGASPLLK